MIFEIIARFVIGRKFMKSLVLNLSFFNSAVADGHHRIFIVFIDVYSVTRSVFID